MLSVPLTGSRCWLTAWMCLIINRAACATTEGLWWQNLRPQCLPLPFCLPKCHLNEIGPRSLGIRHCIITYLKTLIEHFIKRLALRFCQGGHYRESDVFLCACMHACVHVSERVGRWWYKNVVVHKPVCAFWNCSKTVTLNSRVTLLAVRSLACFSFTLHFDNVAHDCASKSNSSKNSPLEIDSRSWVNTVTFHRIVPCSFTWF